MKIIKIGNSMKLTIKKEYPVYTKAQTTQHQKKPKKKKTN